MSERGPERQWDDIGLVDKPLDEMSYEEYVAWYKEYMKSVPEENIMIMSRMQIEIEDDPEAFRAFVTAFQQLKRQGIV